jgi:predicted transcriptional regulator
MTKPIGVKLDDELQTRLKALGKKFERSPIGS